MMFKVFLSHCISKTLFFIIGLQLQTTNGGLLDAVGILGNTLQTGAHGHTVPNLLNQVVGGVGTNQGNTANQMMAQQQVTMQRPNVNNYFTTAPLNNQQVNPNQNIINNVQRPNVAFQQRPMIVQHQNMPGNGYNQQNTGNTGQMVFVPNNAAQNNHQNSYPFVQNQNQLQNPNLQLQHLVKQQNMNNGYQNQLPSQNIVQNQLPNQNIGQNQLLSHNIGQNQLLNHNIGQNGLQHTIGQNNMQQSNNLNNPPSNQNIYQNGRPTSNQIYNGQQGRPINQNIQQPTNSAHYGGSLPPINNVIGSGNIGNINQSTNGVQENGHRNDGHEENGHRIDNQKPDKKDDNGKVHSATVHKVFFQAKPLIVDDIVKDDRDITLYYQE